MFNFLKKKSKDVTLEEAIEFIKQQKSLNLKHMKDLSVLNISIKQCREWDNIYSFIIKTLKSMRG